KAAPHGPVAAVRLEAAQQRIADLERALADMRGERDDWKTQAQRLALPNAHPTRQDGQADAHPDQPDAQPAAGKWRRAWRWMQARRERAMSWWDFLTLLMATKPKPPPYPKPPRLPAEPPRPQPGLLARAWRWMRATG